MLVLMKELSNFSCKEKIEALAHGVVIFSIPLGWVAILLTYSLYP